MVKDGICDFMIPITLYIDKTQVYLLPENLAFALCRCHWAYLPKRQVIRHVSFLDLLYSRTNLFLYIDFLHRQCRRSADACWSLGYVCNEDVFFWT
jgi:hypothetical protein